jgi:alkanesulfonate monooxygenase SsuD/methylene tetrahydromethanopterin reductase-like flavin-dependent oxidoreductase (luciferase family)
MRSLKFGIFDHMDDSGCGPARQYNNRLRLAEACEAAGFYAYHVAEHHGTPHGLAPSPNLLLAAMAQRTARLRLGPLVMLLNLYHPLRAFEEISMLDQMSGGRVELGIGRGSDPIELGFFGVEAAEAQQRYLEASEVILQAMAGGPFSYHGRYFNLQNIPISLAPVQRPHPPVWVGAMQVGTACWAAEKGVNIVCVGSAHRTRVLTDAYNARSKSQTHPGDATPLLGMVRQIIIGDTDEEARALAVPAYQRWVETFTHLSRQRGFPAPPMLPATFQEAAQIGFSIAGSASTVRSILAGQISQAGVNYILCQLAFGTLPHEVSVRTAAALGSEIMPHLAGSERERRYC